jgi:hypothetical protein
VTAARNRWRGRLAIVAASGVPPHSRAIKPAACEFKTVVIRCDRLAVIACRNSSPLRLLAHATTG